MLPRTHVLSIFAFSALASLVAGRAQAGSVPNVDLPIAGTSIDGISVTQTFNDFYSYSDTLLAQFQSGGYLPGNTSNFLFSTGTGTIAILPYTFASGQKNPAPFADPLVAKSNATSFSGTWDQSNVGTVGALLSFLQTNYNSSIPVFYFDNNASQSQASQPFGVSADVTILAPDGTLLASWCFNNATNATPGGNTAAICDLSQTVPVPTTTTLTGTDGATFTVDGDNGSGKPNFLNYSPTMDLRNFSANDIFAVTINFTDIPTGGGQELGIVGAHIESTTIPEPGALALLGAGGLLFGVFARGRRAAGMKAC